MQSPWIIAGAMDSELRGLRSRMRLVERDPLKKEHVWRAEWKGVPLCVVKTGVGPKKARSSMRRLLASERFQGLLSIGFAGALQDGLRAGDILIPREIVSLPVVSGKSYHPRMELFEALFSGGSRNKWRVHFGRMLTSDRVVFSSREKRRLGEKYEAQSVDMESAVLAELAAEASLPLLVVRVVSDEVGVSLPETVALLDHPRKRWFREIVGQILSSPREAMRLFQLVPDFQRASKNLTGFVSQEILDVLIEGPTTKDSTSSPIPAMGR